MKIVNEESSDSSEVEETCENKRISSYSKALYNSLDSLEEAVHEFRNNLREIKQHCRFLRQFRIVQQSEVENTDEKEDSITKLGTNEIEERDTNTSIRNVEHRCTGHEIILEILEKSPTERLRKLNIC